MDSREVASNVGLLFDLSNDSTPHCFQTDAYLLETALVHCAERLL